MSRWLKNVNALLENLDSQVEETVEEHRFNRAAASKTGRRGDGDDYGYYGGSATTVEGLLQEEAKGVDDILARRGLLGGGEEEEEEEEEEEGNVGDGANDDDDGGGSDGGNHGQNANVLNEQLELEGGASAGDVAVSEETINFDGDSSSSASNDGERKEPKKDLFADADGDVIPAENKGAQTKVSATPSSNNQTRVHEEMTTNAAATATTSKPKQAPSSSNLSTITRPPTSNNNPTAAAASLKELRKLRRHVLQLNSDLESAEREIDAQRQELDRAASRMERDRSRHKQEKESAHASQLAEVAALAAAHERSAAQAREAGEAALGEMEERARRAEARLAKEGGERDAELADALERERASAAAAARLAGERATADERVASLTAGVSRLEARLERAASRMELASERERNAEERLDKALSLHARQLGVRQRREGELERTVADLGAALVVAKGKVESAMRAGMGLEGDELFRRSDGLDSAEDDPRDLEARLQDSQDDVETLRAQLALERQRCSTLHVELQDLSKEQADELSGAHARQRQYERKISDLTTTVAELQSSLRRNAPSGGGMGDEMALLLDPSRGGDAIDGTSREEHTSQYSGQYSGDEKKETDHLRKQITFLSEKIFEMQSRIDAGRGEISTLKNRLRSAELRADAAERGLEAANERRSAPASSGMSSADEETGGLPGRRAWTAEKRRSAAAGGAFSPAPARRRRAHPKTQKVESIRSALGLHPGRFPSGGWRETIASLLDTFDAIAVDLGSHFRHFPISRLAFVMYMVILHAWAFFLLVYHAHAQGVTGGDHHGPEALLRSYRHMEQAPKVAAAVANTP